MVRTLCFETMTSSSSTKLNDEPTGVQSHEDQKVKSEGTIRQFNLSVFST